MKVDYWEDYVCDHTVEYVKEHLIHEENGEDSILQELDNEMYDTSEDSGVEEQKDEESSLGSELSETDSEDFTEDNKSDEGEAAKEASEPLSPCG